jgi:hypothetical protein
MYTGLSSPSPVPRTNGPELFLSEPQKAHNWSGPSFFFLLVMLVSSNHIAPLLPHCTGGVGRHKAEVVVLTHFDYLSNLHNRSSNVHNILADSSTCSGEEF